MTRYPKYCIRKVRHVVEKFEVIKTQSNRLDYVDPSNGKGTVEHTFGAVYDKVLIIEEPRLLTEAEASFLSLPYEQDRPAKSTEEENDLG